MNAGFIIAIWVMANVLAVGAYDAWAMFFGTEKDTVSYWLQSWFSAFPILAVALGIVVGHLAWPLHKGGNGK